MSDPISPANPIQVRFQRQSDGSLEVYANVGKGWQHYSSLPVHLRVPDNSYLSTPGYPTMMHLRNKFEAKMLPTKECVVQDDTEVDDCPLAHQRAEG